MSFSIVKLVNSIPRIRERSYLEVGVWDGKNHAQILSEDKVSVDIAQPATFQMPSDQFFAQNTRRFDISFIDADHRLEQATRDYNNAIRITDQCIFMHDMFPDYEMQATETGEYAGDVYRLLYYLQMHKKCELYVLDGDCGMTVLFPPFRSVDFREIERVGYSDLVGLGMKRLSVPAMQGTLASRFVRRSWYVEYLTGMLPVIADLLQEAGIPYWLDWGTLLGAMRIGRMIPWDFDIDLGAFEQDVDRIAWLAQKAQAMGHTLRYEPEYHKFRFFGKNGPDFHIDIDLWGIKHDIAVSRFDERNVHIMYDLINHGAIEFEGRGYPCPLNPEDALARLIGPDWMVPKISQGNLAYLQKYAPDLLPDVQDIQAYASAWDRRGQ
jgi:hypothetical protein